MTGDELQRALEARGVVETVRESDMSRADECWRFTMADGRRVDIQVADSLLHATRWDLGELILAELDAQLDTEAPPEPVREPEAVIEGELVGFRQWSIDSEWKLAGLGVGNDEPWSPGVNTASCAQLLSTHRAPAIYCHCGFNGYAKPDPGWREQRDVPEGWRASRRPCVSGAFLGWGDEFYMHPGGFRAQYATPVLLAVDDKWPRPFRLAVEAIAEDYGCETCEFAILEASAREHGQLVTPEMMPALEPSALIRGPGTVHCAPIGVSMAEAMRAMTRGTRSMTRLAEAQKSVFARRNEATIATALTHEVARLSDPVERARAKHSPRNNHFNPRTQRPPRDLPI